MNSLSSSLFRILHKSPKLHPCKNQMVQESQDAGHDLTLLIKQCCSTLGKVYFNLCFLQSYFKSKVYNNKVTSRLHLKVDQKPINENFTFYLNESCKHEEIYICGQHYS